MSIMEKYNEEHEFTLFQYISIRNQLSWGPIRLDIRVPFVVYNSPS